jgi:hypothetical protein
LYVAKSKGAAVKDETLAKVDGYTKMASARPAEGRASGVLGGVSATSSTVMVSADASAGIPLYQRAQQLEQISRTPEARAKNAKEIDSIKSQLSDGKFVTGFGSIGGEEFFSYLNISDSLRRTGGAEWKKWNTDITGKILQMQNQDGTWAGHHCITGRVAVTSAAILTLTAANESAVLTSRAPRK